MSCDNNITHNLLNQNFRIMVSYYIVPFLAHHIHDNMHTTQQPQINPRNPPKTKTDPTINSLSSKSATFSPP